MLNPDIKQAALQQWDNQWNPPPPKSKWAGCKFRPSPEIAFIPEMEDAQFECLKAEIQEAAAQKTLAKFGKILLRKNKGAGRWEIWDGRSRYLAFVALGLDFNPLLKFVGENSNRSMLSLVIKENVEHRAWASPEELHAFLSLGSAAMANLATKDRVNIQ